MVTGRRLSTVSSPEALGTGLIPISEARNDVTAARGALSALSSISFCVLALTACGSGQRQEQANSPANESLSAAQVAALSDGTITRDEYAAAIDAVRECLVSNGMLVSALEENENGFLSYQIDAGSLGITDVEAEALIDSCENEHGADVQAAYAEQIANSR